jgi:hypothetical protein
MTNILKLSDFLLEEEVSRREKRLERKKERIQGKLDAEKQKGSNENQPVLGSQTGNEKRLSTPFYQIPPKVLPMDQKIEVNNQEIQPYGVANGVMNVWIEEIKNEVLNNIDSKYKNTIKALIEKSLNKIFPIVSKYLIPTVNFNGEKIVQETQIQPAEFWNQIWPQIWKEMGNVERGIVKTMTDLDAETTYEQLVEMTGKALSSENFSGYNQVVTDQLSTLMELFGTTFSAIFKDKPVQISQTLLGTIVKDLNSKGAKIEFKSSEKNQEGQQGLDKVKLGNSAEQVWAERIIKQIEAYRALTKTEGGEKSSDKSEGKSGKELGIKDIKFPSKIESPDDLDKWVKSLTTEQRNAIRAALASNTTTRRGNESGQGGGSSSSGSQTILKRGMKSEEVGELQDKLGMDVGSDKTNFGPNTEAAVKKFQQKKGLKDDGVVGPKTRAALGL